MKKHLKINYEPSFSTIFYTDVYRYKVKNNYDKYRYSVKYMLRVIEIIKGTVSQDEAKPFSTYLLSQSELANVKDSYRYRTTK